jgi:hypothetical protein
MGWGKKIPSSVTTPKHRSKTVRTGDLGIHLYARSSGAIQFSLLDPNLYILSATTQLDP